MKIILTEDAIQDLQEIYEFIAQDNAAAADRHREKLIGRWQALAAQPRMGRSRDDVAAGYRSIAEGDYVIFYQIVTEAELRIMRVLNGRRDIGKALSD